MKNKTVRLFSEKYLENIGSAFKTLYKDELLTDLTLYCKDGSIKVHKLVLAASSSYFRQVFTNHQDLPAVFYMYGITFEQLKNLVELIYKGSINLSPDVFNSVYDLAEELQISGLLVDDVNESVTCTPAPCKNVSYSRDTRFKGKKRVAVDFNGEDTLIPKSTKSLEEQEPSVCMVQQIKQEIDESSKAIGGDGQETSSDLSDDNRNTTDKYGGTPTDMSMDESTTDEKGSLSSWERKERKFKCGLCPSSFKRASHLSRHQLVHTGERPFACDMCEKAFSRHDKLKHHILKAHEPDSNEPLPADALYTIGHVQFLTPEQTMYESSETIMTSEVQEDPTSRVEPNYSLPRQKKRGRPRKHPIVPPSLVKRPRGRPRINPIGMPPFRPKYKRGTSSKVYGPAQPSQAPPENYNITNMPYGDLRYLTTSVNQGNDVINLEDEPAMIEPLVEIQVEPQKDETDLQHSFMQNIGLFENTIGKIGECTISVAPSGN